MKQERLGNIATFINGAAFKPEDWNSKGLRIIRIQNLTNPDKVYNRTLRKVDEKYIVKKGDVLISWSATIDVFTWEDDEEALLNQHIFKVVFDFSKVEKRYFIFALKQTINELTKFAHGSTMKHVVKKDFDNHKILLPALPDQINIAEILTQAENLISKRKESIILLDELLKCIFVEKFIKKEYSIVKLQDITLKITDGEHAKPNYLETGMPFISVKNISKGSLDFTDCKFVSNNDHLKFNKRCNPEFEDIIYTKVGATYGRAVIVNTTEPFSLYVSVALIKPDKTKVNPYFLNAAINHPFVKRQADKSIKGAGVPDLHLIEIKSFKIPFPPIEKQIEFATIVEKIEALRNEYEDSLKELENMYSVLSQKAFKGELKVDENKSFEKLDLVAELDKKIKSKVIKLKPTNSEIYKRTLLAAEIVYQLKDTNTLGHLKLQKMLYLCQEIGEMKLPMNFLKQAMGPYDNLLVRSLDKQFVIKKWFEYQNGALLKYKPLENCGNHKEDFQKYFKVEIIQINYLINKFKKFTSNQIEAVATLYACWKAAIEQKELITDKLIITKFYQWSKEKEKFREENLTKALDWMRRNGVEPK